MSCGPIAIGRRVHSADPADEHRRVVVAPGHVLTPVAMTREGRRSAATEGQLADASSRSRVPSGCRPIHLAELGALIADVGPPCWVDGPTSSGMHELDGYVVKPPFHILVPRTRNIARVGVFVHSSTDIPLLDQETAFGLPVVSPTRTLLSLAAIDPPERVTIALDAALRDGKTTEEFLHRRIAQLRRSGRNGIRPLLRVMEGAEIVRGGHSWLEREFLRLLDDAGLPRPDTQAVLGRRGDTLIRVDARFPGTPVVVELLGYRWHRSKPQLAIDAQRVNRLMLDGFTVLQFTYPMVVDAPVQVVADVTEALRRWRPLAS